MKKPNQNLSVAEIRVHPLLAMVPLVLRAVAQDEAELEARIDADKELSPHDQRKLEDIRARIRALPPAEFAVFRRILRFFETGEREQQEED